MPRYERHHILFLQSLMRSHAMTKMEASELCERCCHACDAEFDGEILPFINTINEKIQPFHIQIKRGLRESTGETVIAIINMNDSEVNQVTIGADYSKVDVEVFQHIIRLILISENGMASSTDILNLINNEITNKNISKGDIEELVRRLIADKWLGEEEGWIYFEPRAYLELEPYFESEFDECLQKCTLCNCFVYRGNACNNCNLKIHKYCFDRYASNNSTGTICPECSEPFMYSNENDPPVSQVVQSSRKRKRLHQ